MISKDSKLTAATPFKSHEKDTGSSSVQIAVLTARIQDLTKHLAGNKKDHSGRGGLLKMVGQRRRLLSFLNENSPKTYLKLISDLNLRK